MSTLVIDTIQGKTTAGSVNVRGEGSNNTNLQQGLAKVWHNFDGTGTISTRDSLNVASITDHTTGDYTYTFTNNMSNTGYAVANQCGGAGQNVFTNRYSAGSGLSGHTTSNQRIGLRNTSDQNWNDNDIPTSVIFGDLT